MGLILKIQAWASLDMMMTDTAPRVLLVDDDPLVLETRSLVLETNGLFCRTAHDGFEAIRHLLEASYDLIISDLRMPRLSGYELLGIIRQRYPQSKTIVISSEICINPEKSGLRVDAYFQKGSFTHNELIRTVRKLRRSQWVDATLAWSLLAGVSKPKVFLGR